MTRRDVSLLMSIAVISIAVAGCNPVAPEPQEFMIRIDSIRAPRAVSADTAFQVLLFGPVGPDGCSRFKALRVTRGSGEADVTVVGERIAGICTAMPVYLEGEPLTVEPPLRAPFSLRVHQPTGAVLTTTIPTK